jgi:integrase
MSYETLIGLLAATGLRPGEALALDVHDVDLTNGILAIRQTKFGKSRFVPVDESTRAALADYAQRRDELCPYRGTEAFLVSERGKRLEPCSTRRTFAMLCFTVGLRKKPEGKRIGRGPRLMDFRHSFATWRIVEWYRAGLNVERQIPKLATYLGHVDISNTYWYIEAIPELLQLATEQLSVRQNGGAS